MPSSEKSEGDINRRLSRRVAGIAWWVRVYRQMFADDDDNAWRIPKSRREAFESASAEFMRRLEVLLREECALELCRLMDPKTSAGQENESLVRLLPLCGGQSADDRVDELEGRVEAAESRLATWEENERRADEDLGDYVEEARANVETHRKVLEAARLYAQAEANMQPLRDWRNTAKAHSALEGSALADAEGRGGGPVWKDVTRAWDSVCAFINQMGGVAPGVKEGLQHQATILSEHSGTKIVSALARAVDYERLVEHGVIPWKREAWVLSENETCRKRVEGQAREHGWWEGMEANSESHEEENDDE